MKDTHVSINDIVKETLLYLNSHSLKMTPENYKMAFCKVSKQLGFIVEDCRKIETLVGRLSLQYQDELKKFKVTSEDELFSFLIAQLNRIDPKESSKQITHLSALLKRVLQSIEMLHVKDATHVAGATLDKLEYMHSTKDIDIAKDKWLDFMTTYDDSYLARLSKFATVDKRDLKQTIDNLVTQCNQTPNVDENLYAEMVPFVIHALSPSIATQVNDKVANLVNEIKNNPEMLSSVAVKNDIKSFLKERVERDKEEVYQQFSSLNNIFEEMSGKFVDFIATGQESGEQTKKIRSEISNIEVSQNAFGEVKEKLLNITNAFEEEASSFTDKMVNNQRKIQNLNKQVKELENKLDKAKKESNEDFLTGLLTRRFLDRELRRAEEAFIRYNQNYSICFMDIDKFKVINDTYGHEAGDLIIATIGKILSTYAREVDICGRYGGEEFLIILPNISLDGGIRFADKIRGIVERYKFIYKGTDIAVTISAGISERRLLRSEQESVVKADEMLYKAKNTGRNQVCPVL